MHSLLIILSNRPVKGTGDAAAETDVVDAAVKQLTDLQLPSRYLRLFQSLEEPCTSVLSETSGKAKHLENLWKSETSGNAKHLEKRNIWKSETS